jgi:PKD repeat protein
MKRKVFLLASFAFLFFIMNARTQDRPSTTVRATVTARISWADAVAYDKTHPAPPQKAKTPNKLKRYYEFPVDPDKIIYREKEGERSLDASFSKDPSPLPEVDFMALGDNNNSIPPDVHGAAGPEHLMVTLNTETRIMDKAGNPLSAINTGSFWFPLPGAGDSFDPKVLYDPYENRWIFVMPSSSNVVSSTLFIAVSETSDPTGDWLLYAFDTDPLNTHWFDYPSYGFNKKWIVVSGNMFGEGFYNILMVFDKHELYEGSTNAGYSRYEVHDAFTIVPAITYDADAEDLYMVSTASGNTGGYGYINLFRISGMVGSEVLENLGLVGIPYPWESWVGNNGNFSPQLGSDEKINSGDGRMQDVIYRNGKIWATHHVFLPIEDPERSAIQWWELGTDGTILQRGRVDDETGTYHFTFPCIAVNGQEDVMIGYCSFSAQQYASSSYSFRYAGDPPDVLRDRYQFKDGLAPYFKNFGSERNRWGDFTATTVDPVNDLDFWTIQEYAELPDASYDRWGTWWAKINVDAVPQAHFSSNITTVPVNSGVNFTDETKYEPSSWQWIFEGGQPATSTEQHPGNIVYSQAGKYDVTLIATNYLGSDTLVMTDYIEASTTILPEVSFTVGDTLPCTGEAVALHDESVYNPIAWQWVFDPDDITFLNGTSAGSQHPEVSFNSPAAYTVSLTATNNNGSASLTKDSLVSAGGLTLPYSEDFEVESLKSRSWLVDNPDDKITWDIAEVSGNSPGNRAAWVNIKEYNVFGARDMLISPLFSLSGHQQAFLEFEYAYAQRYAQYTDSLIVSLSPDCGASWIRLLSLGEDGTGIFATHAATTNQFIPQTAEDWCGDTAGPSCHMLDLSPWSGASNLRVRFETCNGYGNNLFVDNIGLFSTDAIPETFVSGKIALVFPNPTTGIINIRIFKPGEVRLSVYDLVGHLVYADQCSTGEANRVLQADVTGYGKGLYMLRVVAEGQSQTERVLVR